MDDIFNLGSNKPTTNTVKQQQKPQTANFLESIREQGKAATTGVVGDITSQLFGINSTEPNQAQFQNQFQNQQLPNLNQQPFNFAEFLRLREQKIRQQERTLSQQQYRTETVIFHKKEEQAKKEIEFIKAEIKKIIISTGEVATELIEAEKSIMSTTVEVGTYQLNFFDRVRRLLAVAKKRIAESKHWLEMFNGRQQQKSYYWGQVGKSGTKFLLSNERYMSTQAG